LRRTAWPGSSALVALLVLLPLAALLNLSTQADPEIWHHLRSTVLSDYLVTTFYLVAGVAIFSGLLGVGSAVLISQYRFPGASLLSWALLLPLASPAYITAYSYTGLLDVSGPVQSTLRQCFDWRVGDYWFPSIRSLPGAIFVLSLVLYPYVYLLTRAALREQSSNLRYAAASAGVNRQQFIFRVSLPLARPAIVAGIALVVMETLADFGAVSFFGLSTFTTGIFRTWFGLDSVQSAAQLALMLLGFVVLVMVIEKSSRRRAAYFSQPESPRDQRVALIGYKQLLVLALAASPLLFGFIIPMMQLFIWSLQNFDNLLQSKFWLLVGNTLMLASLAAILTLTLALVVSYSARFAPGRFSKLCSAIAGMGYAVPGLVIAVGVLTPLAWFDNWFDDIARSYFGTSTGLLLSGSIAALVIAYVVRFLALGINNAESGLARIHPAMEQSARTLGASSASVIRRVHAPLLRNSVLTGLIIVFVDVMKELPATLVLRPFNFDTLAVRAYELASDERLADAALPSLAIVAVGLIPVILLTRLMRDN